MSIRNVAAALIFSIATSTVFAADAAPDQPDTRTPMERYRGDGAFSMLMCQMAVRMAASTGGGPGSGDEKTDYVACVVKGKATAKTNFDAALKTLKKAQAREALKAYHVALIAAIDGVKPGMDERKISYNQRQQALEQKVTEAWARFEIEN